jgi:hypothetical protein
VVFLIDEMTGPPIAITRSTRAADLSAVNTRPNEAEGRGQVWR